MFTLYTKTGCSRCNLATEALNEHGYQYELKKVDTDPLLLAELKQKVPSASTVPQIFRDGQYIGTFDDLQQWLKDN